MFLEALEQLSHILISGALLDLDCWCLSLPVRSSKATQEPKRHVRRLHSSSDLSFLAARCSPWNKMRTDILYIWNRRLSLVPHNIPPCKTLVLVGWKAALQERTQMSWWTPSSRGVSICPSSKERPYILGCNSKSAASRSRQRFFRCILLLLLGHSALPEEKMKPSSSRRCTGTGQDAADTSWSVGNPD